MSRQTASIVFLHKSPWQMGGGEFMLLRIAGIAAQVAPVHFVDLFGESAPPPEFVAAFRGIAHFDFPLALRVGDAPRFVAGLWALRAYVRRLRGPVCIAFSFPAAFRMALAAPWSGTRLLWFCNFPLGVTSGHRRLLRMIALRTIAMTGATAVCPSRFMADDLAGLGFPRGQIRVVCNAIDVERFAGIGMDAATQRELRRRLGLPEADLVVACVARIDPIKNHGLLLRAVAISRREGIRVALVCVGDADPRDREYTDGLRAEARALGVADLIQWAGPREDVTPWLGAADVFALASHMEAGTPLALLEAGAAGLPLLATRLGSAEVVLPGRTGLVFDADDAEGCAAAMVHLARNEADRGRLGREARQHVRARFGLDVLTVEWLKILESST